MITIIVSLMRQKNKKPIQLNNKSIQIMRILKMRRRKWMIKNKLILKMINHFNKASIKRNYKRIKNKMRSSSSITKIFISIRNFADHIMPMSFLPIDSSKF